jgi:hypothetical protein
MGTAKRMGYIFFHHREHRVHGDFLQGFPVLSVDSLVKVLGKPTELSTLKA